MAKTFIVFNLAEAQYGINIDIVQTVIKILPVTPLPFMPPYMEGLTNLRGEILPVINLCKRLDFEDHSSGKDARMIIIKSKEEPVGFIVDSVQGVREFMEEDIEPPSSLVTSQDIEFMQGIVKNGDELVFLLATDEMLQIERRKSRRREIESGLLFAVEGKPVKNIGDCIDISAGGLQMATDIELFVSQKLALQIDLFHRERWSNLTGYIKWKKKVVKQTGNELAFRYGVQFDIIPPEFKRELIV